MNFNQTVIRLNKRLVQMRLATSRRGADDLITSGKVKVNGQITCELGQKVSASDQIQVNGKTSSLKEHVYIALNKPIGYLSSHRAQGQTSTVFSLLPKTFSNLKIAGRLDKDSSGLLLLSSDGDFIWHITHPSTEKSKMYAVKIDRSLDKNDRLTLLQGVELDDGISQLDHLKVNTPTKLRVTIHSGKKRQLRRTFKSLGYNIMELERIQIGDNLTLTGIKPGKYRFLTKQEVEDLCR